LCIQLRVYPTPQAERLELRVLSPGAALAAVSSWLALIESTQRPCDEVRLRNELNPRRTTSLSGTDADGGVHRAFSETSEVSPLSPLSGDESGVREGPLGREAGRTLQFRAEGYRILQ
jgi:hypothetical protein